MKILEKGKLSQAFRFESGIEAKCLFSMMRFLPPHSPHIHVVPKLWNYSRDKMNIPFSVERTSKSESLLVSEGKLGFQTDSIE